jgi:hypothetical protein
MDGPTRQHNQIAWVGHAPGCRTDNSLLIGQPGASFVLQRRIADVRFNDSIEIGSGELRRLLAAKLLDC